MKRAAPKIAHSQSDARASHSDQSAMTRRSIGFTAQP